MRVAESYASVQDLLLDAIKTLNFQRHEVSFLLGTDVGIQHEARVALTPAHIARLREDLSSLGLRPEILVHVGAGLRARGADRQEGFRDEDYAVAGATLVEANLLRNRQPLDVVHALKEPTEYESEIAGPFLRIGALHLASKPPGVCHMLARKNFAGIFDGGTLGNCSYLQTGADRTPIVACMSRFAGSVAGRQLVRGLAEKGHREGRVIIVGGGVAGRSAIRKLAPANTDLVVIDISPAVADKVKELAQELGFRSVQVTPQLTDQHFEDAIGIIFAHRSGAKAAEKVCHFRQIRKMRQGAAIADIAIDQGGSINHDGYDDQDDATASRAKYQILLADYFYYAETNMPREEPHEASEMHGDASLPYVTLLMALCAHHGTPTAVVEDLLRLPGRIYNDHASLAGQSLLVSFKQDLRNGLQLSARDGRLHIVDPDIERDTPLKTWITGCAG